MKISRLLGNRAFPIAVVALLVLASMAAIAYAAAPPITSDAKAPAVHAPGVCTDCHVVVPAGGAPAGALASDDCSDTPGVPCSDDCSGTLEAKGSDDCSGTPCVDDCDDALEAPCSDDCSDTLEADDSAQEQARDAADKARDAAEDALDAAEESAHETVTGAVRESDDGESQGPSANASSRARARSGSGRPARDFDSED